ncbi:histidinol-phosphate transaminase [Virgibacillus sediminis]|uniref:Histidinol-phosphate aminotransferase n=1 Tax=Virgibacillus sediminis TaxID=202260 RepID=A0ABV7A3S5_9BACI
MATSNQIQPRKVLGKIKPYTPGKPIWELQEELKLDKVVKLASNENPLGPSPRGVQAIADSLDGLNRYPDADTSALKKSIASSMGVTKEQVIVTNGADELITLVSEAFLEEGDEIIVPFPSFSEYDFGAQLMGAEVVPVQLEEDFQFDVDKMISAITDKTKLIYICSPNNPTGTYLPKSDLEKLLQAMPEHVLMVYDAAYSHYATAEDYTDGVEYVKAGYPIIALQTFSKIYGLAGVRVGFGVAPDYVIQTILKVKEPFNVNALAQAAAAAAISDEKHIEASREMNIKGADQLYHLFSELGLSYIQTQANFVLVDLGPDAKKVNDELLTKGVIVRYGNTWGMPEHVRVSIGTQEENQFFAEALRSILNK